MFQNWMEFLKKCFQNLPDFTPRALSESINFSLSTVFPSFFSFRKIMKKMVKRVV